ncbi:MAG: hypothetical protein HYY13_03250 [Nitrospirae bacterium]|nr:hypothetical protein [Nitrospirota bacterium]
MNGSCFKCGAVLVAEGRITRNDVCEKCSAYIRVCYNCSYYDAHAPHECAEPSAEPVLFKDRANLCDFFRLAQGRRGGKGSAGIPEDARKLFKDM